MHKLTARQMTRQAAWRRAGLRAVSLRLVGFAVASYIAITQFVHESECRVCVISVDIAEVVSLSNSML